MITSFADEAYFCDITVKNIYQSFTHKMAAKASWHWNYVTVTHCIAQQRIAQKRTAYVWTAHQWRRIPCLAWRNYNNWISQIVNGTNIWMHVVVSAVQSSVVGVLQITIITDVCKRLFFSLQWSWYWQIFFKDWVGNSTVIYRDGCPSPAVCVMRERWKVHQQSPRCMDHCWPKTDMKYSVTLRLNERMDAKR